MSFRMRRPFALICVTAFVSAAFVAAPVFNAQARDLTTVGDFNYNIMAPEPGTGPRHVTRDRQGRTSSRHSQSLTAAQKTNQDADHEAIQSADPAIDTPEQIEAYKRNRRAFASRGSSGLVLPTPLPGPTHYAPVGTSATFHAAPQEQGPTILPGSGLAIPNLPHGPETFQDRASRCAAQSSINSVPGGQMSSYMHNCAM
jgi:hypothetical protein